MQSHEVGALAVDAFDDVDFTVCGPGVGLCGPEGGPCSADAGGHVGEIEDDETVGVGFGALHSE